MFDPKDTIGFAVGASLRGRVSRAISLSVYGEYNYSAPDVEIFRATAGSGLELEKVGEAQNVRFDYVALGAVISAMIW